ncbi:hypothetical protein ABZ897_16090 [Nonomuraea sp. NPDC046802]|uniref:hypothetical protein n=1 Tax=Nonomuraea sp. NPDC046802 TaxID=3154919 RepID=UPI0033C09877
MLPPAPFALDQLAEDLHIAVAVGEYTEAGAIALIAHMGGLDDRMARRTYRRENPSLKANTYDLATMRPLRGAARRIWDLLHGPTKGEQVMPGLFATYGEVVFRFVNLR